MKQINKNNVKKVLAAAGKFVGQKAAPAIGWLGMLFNTSPLSAQPAPKPTGQKLVPNTELSFTCVNIEDTFYYINNKKTPFVDRTLDLDGDYRTTNDQVHSLASKEKLVSNPQYILRLGDEVVGILTLDDINGRNMPLGRFLYIRGEIAEQTR